MLKDNRGFSLVGLMMALTVVSISSFSIIQSIQLAGEAQSKVDSLFQLNLFRQNLVELVQNQRSWTQIIAATENASMACLRDGGIPCLSNQAQLFAVKDGAGATFYDPVDSSAGIGVDGRPCSGFSATEGNDNCPFRFEVVWEPVCAVPCNLPQVKITARLIHAPKKVRRVIKLAKYEIPAVFRAAQ